MRRRLTTFLTVGLTGFLFLISTPASATPTPSQQYLLEDNVLGEGEGDSETTQGSSAKVNALDRTEGGITALAWTLENRGSDTISIQANVVGNTYLYRGSPFSGVTLLDEERQVRYHPLMDEDGACLCSAGEGVPPEFVTIVLANRLATYSSMFQLPEDVDAVTVEIPGFEPIEDVPVE